MDSNLKVDFSKLLNDLSGQPIKNDKGGEDLILKDVAIRALTTALPEDQALTGEQAFKRLELARRIHQGGEQELDPAEAVLIRDRVPKIWVLEISGQVYEMLKG